MMPLIVIGILVVGAIFILAGMYNSLVQLRVRADSSWSDIDVQLKRRHDLLGKIAVQFVLEYCDFVLQLLFDLGQWVGHFFVESLLKNSAESENADTFADSALETIIDAREMKSKGKDKGQRAE